ncbi:MAG: VCBS repeat-containing protein, partial [Cyclobacteriaceae bacterium]|nr:VCBS repeat-containing protein [Cyclobacteriaceae bacterium]
MKKLIPAIISIGFAFSGFSQEICNNGIDDDGDGFIDCYDNECAGTPDCGDSYLSDKPDCEVPPDVFPTFSLDLEYYTPNRTTSGNSLVSIGDVDGDGKTEIVSVNYYTSFAYVIDGATGAIKYQRNLGNRIRPYLEVMTADVNRDGCAEIFMPVLNQNTNQWEIRAYNCDLTVELWVSTTLSRPGNIAAADFDEDGLVEIYARDEIFDAQTGFKMAGSSFSANNGNANFIDKHLVAGGVAVDLLDDNECASCQGLELAIGGKIYSVNINRGMNAATLNLERSVDHFPVYYNPWRQNRGGTSVADYNQDGFLDVIYNGVTSTDPQTAVFFWDVRNNNLLGYKDTFDNWDRGVGRLNIADVDGDGNLNVTYVSGPFLYALDENWNLLWKRAIIENSSGTTGTTVFDFNGDGSAETVYRDEQNLYIVDGMNGNFLSSIPCRSLTFMEYPIVADVDNDGETEICVTCLTNDNDDIYNDIGDSHIRVFRSKDDKWVPARKVWNQHAYFNVNVNDDLSIPIQMQKHHLAFSSGTCKTGPVKPLNSFLNQAPYLTVEGCPNYGAADLNFGGNVAVTQAVCPDTDFQVSFDISNSGDKDVLFDIPITFYNGDPFTATSTKLNTTSVFLSIPAGQTVRVNNLTVFGPGGSFNLYISVNDDGSGTPPIAFPLGGLAECDYSNNVGSIPINNLPVPIQTNKLSDNTKCMIGGTDNGAAEAFVLINGVPTTAGYTFNWWFGNNPTGQPAYTGPIVSNLKEGTYSVTAYNNTVSCGSDTIFVNISLNQNTNPNILVSVDNALTQCDVPNGQLSVAINSTEPLSNFDILWLDGSTVGVSDTISINAIASGLTNKDYTVIVKDKTTGCETTATTNLPSNIVIPVVEPVVNSQLTQCTVGAENGEIEAFVGGLQTGYTFNWYDGNGVKPTPDFTGPLYSNLLTGDYTVVAINNTTQCESLPVTLPIVNNQVIPVVNPTIINHQTSCSTPNGSASVDVNGNSTDYIFQWFSGQTTSALFELPNSPAPLL